MSTFQLTQTNDSKTTVVAQNVTHIEELDDFRQVNLVGGDAIQVTNTYRSIRGYLNKALNGPKVDNEDDAE